MKRILLFFLLLVGMATAGNAQTKIIMGDMNRDETITIADVTNLVNVLLGKSEMQYITRADFGKPVTGITIDQTSLTLGEGGTATLTATVVPSDAGDTGVIWTSSNPSVATVSSGNGQCELYLESYGSTKIAVIKAVMAITGLALADAKALVEGELPASLGIFEAATAADHKATLEEAGATVSISGGEGGTVTALAPGTAVITATTVDGGYTATCTVTVLSGSFVAVTGVGLSASSITIQLDLLHFPVLNVTVQPEDATNKNVSWSSSDESVAHVEAVSFNQCYLVPEGEGTATITATTEDGGYTATCEVTVERSTGIWLDVEYVDLLLGNQFTITATVMTADGTNPGLVWSSSNESVVAITNVLENTATIQGNKTGTATITAATEDGRFSASCLVTVTYDYVEMGDGLKWATCNVGANSPEQYGDYFAWAETTSKTEYSWATYKYMTNDLSDWRYINKYQIADGKTDAIWYYDGIFTGDGKTELDPEDDAATVNLGEGWRMPTRAEWENLSDTNKFVWTWTDDYNGTGIKGEIVTSKVPGYVGNQIFLPAAGHHGTSQGEGLYGGYWSSSLDVYTTNNGIYFYFMSSITGCYQQSRSSGQPVRAVSE